jgi:predicted DNA-binding transcriptional regulator AlpA
VTLGRWIRDQDFPAGVLLGPNTGRWPEGDVERWLEARRVANSDPVAS